jgi:hypothetical protein
MAYVSPQQQCESRKAYKRRIYDTLHHMAKKGAKPSGVRITNKYPNVKWGRVWENLHSRALSDSLTSTWYVAVHEIFPTNDRLAVIQLAPSSACSYCGKDDSIQHRITDCGEGTVIWNWTRID